MALSGNKAVNIYVDHHFQLRAASQDLPLPRFSRLNVCWLGMQKSRQLTSDHTGGRALVVSRKSADYFQLFIVFYYFIIILIL